MSSRRAPRALVAVLPVALVFGACGADDPDTREVEEPPTAEVSSELVAYDCAESQDTGYKSGSPFSITVVHVDGEPVEVQTANAFLTMAKAAEGAGVALHINSGFRTMAEQQYFYACYVNCNCNNCNLAAKPGYSNHQSGHALDLATGGGALAWLNANGAKFGFSRTVPSEDWHWEWWGGGAPDKYCGAPPPCDRSAGGWLFSCDGAEAGMDCVNVNEPDDPDSWADNHLCGPAGLGMKWSPAGPIAGMECVNVAEGAESHAAAWADNYLCLPPQSPVVLAWSSAGPIAGQACVQWNEPADPESWSDNHLCVAPRTAFSSGPFTFSGSGPVAGMTCESVDEPSDPDTWADNFFCSRGDFGLRWSHAGALPAMTCTNVAEAAEQNPTAWADNFLCAPPQTPWTFTWSSAGPVAGKACVRWYEAADLAGSFGDNWLCYDPVRDFSLGGFTFSGDGPEPGKSCVAVSEPSDPDSWTDNHFCSDAALGMKWSSAGPIAGMRCTKVTEPGDEHAAAWADDHLCVPADAPWAFTWSSTGPLAEKTCVRWFEHAEPGVAWSDNWMCAEPVPPLPGGAGGSGGAAGQGAAGGAKGGAAGLGGAGPAKGGAAGQGHAAGGAGASGAGRALVQLDGEETSGSCAVAAAARGASGDRPRRVAALGALFALFALAWARRRRCP
ncbi:MAG: M15 family metallopeptidase [Polyangiaceae bacterium]|nr:M15 family metallopeptidase [Polyangiaceae bacterium]